MKTTSDSDRLRQNRDSGPVFTSHYVNCDPNLVSDLQDGNAPMLTQRTNRRSCELSEFLPPLRTLFLYRQSLPGGLEFFRSGLFGGPSSRVRIGKDIHQSVRKSGIIPAIYLAD